eukprot:CAMPEP_0198511514 /NCGR_PEP_ID=MMETSP1462-20131121/14858_1 /TAXON_ID=1333877 /ORGANISM="Brandtodinium nutriculum, Strain RCC3387" /LENGTH=143 /DNA_ID=CAMNT_0044240885 /DNA_START=178 /DNA_END=605 /DNA_ORIENTATION=-
MPLAMCLRPPSFVTARLMARDGDSKSLVSAVSAIVSLGGVGAPAGRGTPATAMPQHHSHRKCKMMRLPCVQGAPRVLTPGATCSHGRIDDTTLHGCIVRGIPRKLCPVSRQHHNAEALGVAAEAPCVVCSIALDSRQAGASAP